MKNGLIVIIGFLVLLTACNPQAAPTPTADNASPAPVQPSGTPPTALPNLPNKAPTNPATWTPAPSETVVATKTRVPSTPTTVPTRTATAKAVASSTRETGPGAIQGTFTDSITVSFVNQKVQLLKAQDKVAEAVIQGNGAYKFEKINPGSYTLSLKIATSSNITLCELNVPVTVVTGETTIRNFSFANCGKR